MPPVTIRLGAPTSSPEEEEEEEEEEEREVTQSQRC